MKDNECLVVVVEDDEGIVQGCIKCGEILIAGKFLVGMHARKNGSDLISLLGAPLQEHCGEQIQFLQCFVTKSEAEARRLEVISHISRYGTTKGLTLMGLPDPRFNSPVFIQ